MDFVDIAKELMNFDGPVIIGMVAVVIKLVGNHVMHRFSDVETKLDKLSEKLDKLPCKDGSCK